MAQDPEMKKAQGEKKVGTSIVIHPRKAAAERKQARAEQRKRMADELKLTEEQQARSMLRSLELLGVKIPLPAHPTPHTVAVAAEEYVVEQLEKSVERLTTAVRERAGFYAEAADRLERAL